jgi:2-hydroxychromene-2-carboxylate isomerase
MDCRREANRRGTQKTWDSSLANIGMLYAKERGILRAYHDRVFERFWKRELDIESVPVLSALLGECGTDASDFSAFAQGEGRALLRKAQAEAEASGVFGVPSFLLADGDLYWGREHIPTLAQMQRARG